MHSVCSTYLHHLCIFPVLALLPADSAPSGGAGVDPHQPDLAHLRANAERERMLRGQPRPGPPGGPPGPPFRPGPPGGPPMGGPPMGGPGGPMGGHMGGPPRGEWRTERGGGQRGGGWAEGGGVGRREGKRLSHKFPLLPYFQCGSIRGGGGTWGGRVDLWTHGGPTMGCVEEAKGVLGGGFCEEGGSFVSLLLPCCSQSSSSTFHSDVQPVSGLVWYCTHWHSIMVNTVSTAA